MPIKKHKALADRFISPASFFDSNEIKLQKYQHVYCGITQSAGSVFPLDIAPTPRIPARPRQVQGVRCVTNKRYVHKELICPVSALRRLHQ